MTEDSTHTDSLAKATLFCPECGHSGRYDGDWTRIRDRRDVRYLCPACHTEITVRRRERSTSPTPYGVWQTWTNSLHAWQNAWWDSLLHP